MIEQFNESWRLRFSHQLLQALGSSHWQWLLESISTDACGVVQTNRRVRMKQNDVSLTGSLLGIGRVSTRGEILRAGLGQMNKANGNCASCI